MPVLPSDNVMSLGLKSVSRKPAMSLLTRELGLTNLERDLEVPEMLPVCVLQMFRACLKINKSLQCSVYCADALHKFS